METVLTGKVGDWGRRLKVLPHGTGEGGSPRETGGSG